MIVARISAIRRPGITENRAMILKEIAASGIVPSNGRWDDPLEAQLRITAG
jgi:hypothetical protein